MASLKTPPLQSPVSNVRLGMAAQGLQSPSLNGARHDEKMSNSTPQDETMAPASPSAIEISATCLIASDADLKTHKIVSISDEISCRKDATSGKDSGFARQPSETLKSLSKSKQPGAKKSTQGTMNIPIQSFWQAARRRAKEGSEDDYERWLASMDKLFRQHALSYEELPRSKPPCLALLFEADKGRTCNIC